MRARSKISAGGLLLVVSPLAESELQPPHLLHKHKPSWDEPTNARTARTSRASTATRPRSMYARTAVWFPPCALHGFDRAGDARDAESRLIACCSLAGQVTQILRHQGTSAGVVHRVASQLTLSFSIPPVWPGWSVRLPACARHQEDHGARDRDPSEGAFSQFTSSFAS